MFKKVHLKNILVLGISVTITFLLFVVLATEISINKVNYLVDIEKNDGHFRESMERSKFHVSQIHQFLTDASLTHEQDSIKDAKENLEELKKILDQEKILKPELKVQLENIFIFAKRTYDVGIEMTNAYWKEGSKAGNAIMKRPKTGLDERSVELEVLLNAQLKQAEQMQNESFSQLKNLTKTISIFSYVISALLIILIFGVLWIIWSRVNPLIKVTEEVGNSSSEIANSVNSLETLSQTVLSAVSHQIAAIHQTSVALDEISAMMERSSERSEQARQSTIQSKIMTDEGKQNINHLISTMDFLEKSFSVSGEKLMASNSKVSEITNLIELVASKTQVINEIVFQTKLLSFNASVEAARAGEHGKGFAVVAEEIGNLAQMSGKSAQEINEILKDCISQVRTNIDENRKIVEAMVKESAQKLKESVKISYVCQKSFESILQVSSNVTELVNDITNSSNETSKGVVEVTQAIQQINQSGSQSFNAAKAIEKCEQNLSQEVHKLRLIASHLSTSVKGKPWINKFLWKDDYLLGVEEMDDEHKILVNKINIVADTFQNKNTRELFKNFSDLEKYTQLHFEHEEAYLLKIKYPNFSQHKKIHENLLNKLGAFSDEIAQSHVNSEELMDFLNDWLLVHILGVDMKYARFSKGELNSALISLDTSS